MQKASKPYLGPDIAQRKVFWVNTKDYLVSPSDGTALHRCFSMRLSNEVVDQSPESLENESFLEIDSFMLSVQKKMTLASLVKKLRNRDYSVF